MEWNWLRFLLGWAAGCCGLVWTLGQRRGLRMRRCCRWLQGYWHSTCTALGSCDYQLAKVWCIGVRLDYVSTGDRTDG
uniref:Uncharacterized protein n=1 Tax=Oryza punctata TaxID=4537 RepID=A0A0E0LWL9_ORYPU